MTVASLTPAEKRIVLRNVSWKTFERLIEELGEDRKTRLAYSEGFLEIMTPLGEHENNNRFIESLIGAIADELNLNMKRFGSLTLKRESMQQGAEPDSCYYFVNEPMVREKQKIDLNFDPPPDLVLEIDITSSSLNKQLIYAAIGVPEIWRYDGRGLEFFVLQEPILIYNKVQQSSIFPGLSFDVIPRFMRQSLIDGETATLRAFRVWVREQNW
ncbi:hypothetical protein BCD67_05295 [Oscillatoriales cyanobacterium USR001]|nr:hypothetical protein BCD67_05295 [Oscillatoriales cyanobacterium USR001]